jgi:hypothetical protein
MNAKMYFFDVVCEVKKGLQDVSAGKGIYIKNNVHHKFLLH